MRYVTIPDVEIAHVGMNWPASTGNVTLTFEHLADAVTAAMHDPHILLPRLKVGHVDPRFNEDPPVHDPFKYHGPLDLGGNPVYGRVANLRLANDGAVLLGDYIDMPEWLGGAVASAYPNRSLEGAWDITTDWTLDGTKIVAQPVETPGGKRYSFVITALALLGEPLPAISCLEDLEAMLTGGPAAVTARAAVAATRRENMPVNAAASVDAVIRHFFDGFATEDSGRYWWWPVDVWVDPNQVIADDDEGHLFRVPFTSDDDGNVTFGDPVRVMQEFRDLPAVAATQSGQLVARFAAAAIARPQDRVRAANQTTEEARMPLAPAAVLERLGLAEDATEEQILAALDREQQQDPEDPSTPDEPDEPETPAAEREQQQPVAASDRVVQVDRGQWEQAQTDAQLGRQARLTQLSADADKLVDDAKRDGRIAPASAAAWRQAILPVDATELVTTEVAALAALEKNRIPVEERGVAATLDANEQSAHADLMMAAYGIDVTAGKVA